MRVHGEPAAILPLVRKAIQQIDPNLPLMQPMTQRAQFEKTISTQLLFARLAEFFGILAVMLVATGLYGTLAYRVNNRTVEIGVRSELHLSLQRTPEFLGADLNPEDLGSQIRQTEGSPAETWLVRSSPASGRRR